MNPDCRGPSALTPALRRKDGSILPVWVLRFCWHLSTQAKAQKTYWIG